MIQLGPVLKRGENARGLATKAIHEGNSEGIDIIPPIYQTAIFKHPFGAQIRGRELKYSREDNPTVNLLEKRMAALEGGEDCLAFSSGMAAISTLVMGTLSKGDTILTSKEIYGATLILFRSLEKFGIKVEAVLNESVQDHIRRGTKMVFVETITNPVLKVSDIPSLIKTCKEEGAIMVVDNTFATPVNFRPLEFGADYVVESATKYLGGHNDVIAGILAGSGLDQIWEWRRNLGGSLDPFAAYLVLRGLKTLKLRVQEHNRRAQEVAEYLEGHRKVKRVHYPGLRSSRYFEVASRFMKGFGGVVAFEVEGGEKAQKLLRSFRLIKTAPSLGGAETLITHPASSSHKNISPAERKELGIEDGLLRISVGLEDIEDIIRDLEQGLDSI
ncbi:MAG: aminotransferase class I/II-fold pyridoxal phosphate-dependent enzyme [Candidatus Verstraetearchaeota archaeon]|uniref:Cystathionine gamma-synthase family protein n=1 Tax=Thermoproteota archaeon TaxID=2056631 RepID=A0A523BES7_9CREN|nr:aminotransferase class I/II-fold pyridoxal phosphate-dependent enzyme [Candidatus Verstraetearchaeota archaeon]TDA39404.1 MAG: cystathionine gamma-synthase family protein [Candidatus Verstraetearchaeota archaeon]